MQMKWGYADDQHKPKVTGCPTMTSLRTISLDSASNQNIAQLYKHTCNIHTVCETCIWSVNIPGIAFYART